MAKGTDKVIAIKRKADAAAKAAKATAPPAAPAPAKAAKPKEPPAKAAQSASKGQPAPAVEAAATPAPAAPTKPRSKPLEPAWLGWPKVERHGLYIHRASDGQLVCFHKFAATYAAKKFLEAAANGEKLVLLPDGAVSFSTYLVTQISRDSSPVNGTMQEIVEHKYTPEEAAWELPMPYDGYAAQLAGIARPRAVPEAPATAASAKASPAKEAAPKQPRAPRAAGSGKSDPYAIRADMPMSRKVRRTAQRLQMEETGKEEGWQAMKPRAAKLVKDQGL